MAGNSMRADPSSSPGLDAVGGWCTVESFGVGTAIGAGGDRRRTNNWVGADFLAEDGQARQGGTSRERQFGDATAAEGPSQTRGDWIAVNSKRCGWCDTCERRGSQQVPRPLVELLLETDDAHGSENERDEQGKHGHAHKQHRDQVDEAGLWPAHLAG